MFTVRVQAFLIKGEYGRLADMDGYTDATSA